MATGLSPNEQAVLGAQPLSLEHFREWASHLVLDNGERWVLEPFQADFYGDVLERWGEPCEDWLIVPEGNGKSTSLSGFALYVCAFSPDAMIPVAASSRDQAKIVYRQAKGFVRRTWGLDGGVFRAFDGYRRITYLPTDSNIEIFAADDRTGDGIIPRVALVDELHRHRSMDLYQTWRGKLDKLNAHLMVISTAGEPGGEFEEARERMRQAADTVERSPGRVRALSRSFVLHDWSVAEDGDPDDLGQVKAANPFSGITLETLRRKHSSPTMTPQHWRRFVCNLPTRSDYAAIQEAEWFGAQVTDAPPVGEPVWLGLDLGWKWDTTAAVPLWWKSEEYRLFYAPQIIVPPRDGTSTDPYQIKAALKRVHERNPVHTCVMDMHRGEDLAAWIGSELGAVVVDRTQSNKYAAQDYERFTEALREGWIRHDGDREFTRHVLNAIARVLPMGDARFERPVQSRVGGEQDRRVIDALSAAAMVHSVAAGEQEQPFFIA